MLTIYVDGDACPVKDEIYRVARRYAMNVVVVANSILRVPNDPLFQFVLQPESFNAADDWIAENAGVGDIVVTADIPLAARCLEKQALVIDSRGRKFTDKEIGSMLAMRDLMGVLRDEGSVRGGPSAMNDRFRSNFLSRLDETVNQVRRKHVPKASPPTGQ